MINDTNLIKRFMKQTKMSESGCWEWTGLLSNGYGCLWNGDRYISAHRFSMEYFRQLEIPDKLEVHHHCHNRKCVNPQHLEIVTRHDNRMYDHLTSLTECPYGHPYTIQNTYTQKDGTKICIICRDATLKICQARRAIQRRILRAQFPTKSYGKTCLYCPAYNPRETNCKKGFSPQGYTRPSDCIKKPRRIADLFKHTS